MAGIAAILRDVTPRFRELKALRRRLAEHGAGPDPGPTDDAVQRRPHDRTEKSFEESNP
jgi:hypothetical protein